MNWIKIWENKIETISIVADESPDKYKKNWWSNYPHAHSVKIKINSNFDLADLIVNHNKYSKKTFIKQNDTFYDAKFIISSYRVLSTTREYKIIKLILNGFTMHNLPLEIQRDLKLSDLFEL